MNGLKHSFVLFRSSGRILCCRKEIESDCLAFLYEGRQYRLAANLYEHCHLLDGDERLSGFEIHDFGKYEHRLKHSRFLGETKNHEFDGYFLRIRLQVDDSVDLQSDGASLVGPLLYHDGAEDYLIVLDDFNLRNDNGHQWGSFWDGFGFKFAPDDIAPKTLLDRAS